MRRTRLVLAVLGAAAVLAGGLPACASGAGPATPDARSSTTLTGTPPPATATTPATTPGASSPSPSTTGSSVPPTTPQPTARPRTGRPAPAPSTRAPTTAADALPAALRGVDWERIPTSRKVVALTFDGGSSDTAVASILRTLASQQVRATFFLTGDFARRYPAQVARIRSAGHLVGNHSDRHRAYPGLTDEQIRADLAAADRQIVAAGGGATTRPFFRFPFGDRTAADIRVVNDSGYLTVRWTVDTLGWKGTSGGVDAAVVRARVLDTARPGQVVLMHVGSNPDDGTTLDADALPGVIAGLRSMGYGFVTLDAMVGEVEGVLR